MYISREEYLNLANRADFLEQENQVLLRENQILAAEIEKQKSINYELMFQLESIKETSQVLNERVVNQNEALHHDLKGFIGGIDQKQRSYLHQQFEYLEKSAFQKYKVLQIKNTLNRIENHDLLEFIEKVKKIYSKSTSVQQQPSMKDLLKWIKANKKKQDEPQESVSASKLTKKIDDTGSSWKHSKVK